MQSGCKSLLLRSRGSLERPDVYTQVRFRHKKQRHVVPGRAPIVSNTAMMELAYHHSKPVVRNTKPKWYDYFPGREPLPKYYISRPKPDWRRFSIDKILEFSKVIPEVSFRNKLLYWIENGAWIMFRLGLIAAGGWLFRNLFFFPTTLGGPSMLPTFNSGSTGDIVLIGTYGARRRGYEIGDVVVAKPPDPKKQNPGKRVLKRIRAMEGDTIILDDKTEFMMPKDHFWLQGDNPHRSLDSRMYGPVPIQDLVGKVIYRVYPNPGRIQKDLEAEATEEEDAAFDEAQSMRAAGLHNVAIGLTLLLISLPLLYGLVWRQVQAARKGYRELIATGHRGRRR